VKLIRFYKGFNIFHVPTIMEKIKINSRRRSIEFIRNNPRLAEDKVSDHNEILKIVRISYTLRILKLIIIILTFSYFLGMFWLIFNKLVEDFFLGTDYSVEENALEHEDAFMVFYNLVGLSNNENIIVYTYFAFTSLSTVGFGDYCPRSNEERAVGGFILLFGVALFSYIMGNFISIIDNYRQYEDEYN
jgi:hypothetical protein